MQKIVSIKLNLISSFVSRKIIVLIIICFIGLVSYSQVKGLDSYEKIKNLEHKYWDEISSIPIQRVFDIEQDSIGYLWIGCDRGLLRFDGAEVKAYTFKDFEVLKIDNINYVEIGNNNTIWLANRRGLFYLKDNQIKEVKINNESVKNISSIELDSNQKLWVTTYNRKLFSIENFSIKEEFFSEGKPYKVYEGYNNNIWMTSGTTEEMDIWKLDSSGKFIKKELDSKILGLILSFSENKDGTLIYGINNEMYKVEGEKVSHLFNNNGHKEFRKSVKINNNRAIWFAGDGLQRFYNGKLDSYNEVDGLGSDKVRVLFFDRLENLWVGTDFGLNFFGKSPFTSLKLIDENDVSINCVLEVDDDEVLVGSNGKGLLIKKNNQLLEIVELSGLGKVVKTLAKTNVKGEYLVGTSSGLFRIKKQNLGFHIIKQYNDSNIDIVYCLKNGEIWYTESKNNIEGFTSVLKDQEKYPISSLNNKKVFSMLENTIGDFWIGTSSGLYNYKINNKNFQLDKNQKLDGKYIHNIEPGLDESIWVGTYGSGLLHIDKNGNEIIYNTRNGLPVNQATFHLTTTINSLWYYVPDKNHGKFQKLFYYENDSLNTIYQGRFYSLSNNIGFNNMLGFPKSIQLKDSSYLIASQKSFVKFNPNIIEYSKPILNIEKVVSNGVEIEKDSKIIMKANDINFEFHYSSLDLIRGKLQKFEYKLEGFDESWQKADNRRVAYYSTLPAGDYKFKVRVLSNTGEYIEINTPQLFTKKEFWWKTKTAYFFYVLSILTIIITIYRLRVTSLKKQRKKLQLQVANRTAELNELNTNLEQKVIDRTFKITEINKELTQSQERYKYALEASNEGIWDWNVNDDKITFSTRIYTMLGYQPLEFEQSREAIYNCIVNEDKKLWHKSKHELLIQKNDDSQILDEYKMYKKDGEVIWVQLKAKIVERNKDGSPKRLVGTHSDITNEKQKANELLEAVLKTENIERSRISRDIHDGLQQTLTISSMNFQSAKKEIKKLSDKAIEKFEIGWKYLQSSITESRAVAHSLMPKAILDFGVVSAFESLIDEMDKSSENIVFKFIHNFKNEKLENQQIEITLYRILQESINNIIKYSKAKNVTIQLKDYSDIYLLTIEDDGVGFDVNKVKEEESGLGFKSMQNRLEAVNGFIEIDSRIGKGTTIIVEIDKKI